MKSAYSFRPRWWAALLAAAGCVAGVLLGNWQAGRAEEKRASAANEQRMELRGAFLERYTVLRSPHIDRKSREQFEIRTHKRLIDILQPTGKTIEALNKGLSLPPGVDIKIRVMAAGGGS